jgi:hypothetical protein
MSKATGANTWTVGVCVWEDMRASRLSALPWVVSRDTLNRNMHSEYSDTLARAKTKDEAIEKAKSLAATEGIGVFVFDRSGPARRLELTGTDSAR